MADKNLDKIQLMRLIRIMRRQKRHKSLLMGNSRDCSERVLL